MEQQHSPLQVPVHPSTMPWFGGSPLHSSGRASVEMAERCGFGCTAISRKEMLKKVDHLMKRLTDYQVLKGKYAQMSEAELTHLCSVMPDVLMEDAIVMDIHMASSLYIVGDIYGQFGDLLRIFMRLGYPPENRYLFLGNYINRGTRSIETLAFLYALKLRYPRHIYLLRGNHECQHISRHYGFFDECVKRYNRRLWRGFVSTFDYLPLIAIIEEKIFCCHSGMSPSVQFSGVSSLQEFRDYVAKLTPRPTEINTNILMTHYTWSEPDPEVNGWEQNPAGLAYLYGPSVVKSFCERLGIQQIIRSNELLEKGYEFFCDERLLTIFSVPNFLGAFTNDGAIAEVSKDPEALELICRIKLVKPIMQLRNKMTGRMNIAIQDSLDSKNEEEEDEFGNM
ncbi:protein phosphatase 1 catalytic subunit [Echinococcus multilocularis]|uniref:Serine/threonine-protein phosphatase n=1 Tax=Echinococcus multilocularis TaxID=6211 RepID=A0A068YFW3_ECHMU|nr:protein phosphatase 1 catalytic subunit [Echinococcus multilocularis]